MRRDLRRIVGAFVAVLDIGLLLAIFSGGKGFSSVADSLLFIVAGNVSVALMMWPTTGSLSRALLRSRRPRHDELTAAAPRPRACRAGARPNLTAARRRDARRFRCPGP